MGCDVCDGYVMGAHGKLTDMVCQCFCQGPLSHSDWGDQSGFVALATEDQFQLDLGTMEPDHWFLTGCPQPLGILVGSSHITATAQCTRHQLTQLLFC